MVIKTFFYFPQIYPSEFGKERLKEEEITGPKELTETAEPQSDNSDIEAKEEDAEESEFQREKLREYQLNRLKYFYAVIECDSVATADKLYAECDGIEYESTACKLDFRFIPDDETFDEPREVCEELPDLSKYKPRLFTTKALQQGKVELTWDENDMERREIQEKLLNGEFQDVPDEVLKKYVACSSSESEADDGNASESSEEDLPTKTEDNGKKGKKSSIDKYKSLLNEINQQEEERKNQQIEREFTWGIGMESDLTSKKVQKVKQDLTPFEKILEKKKEKRKARKVEIKRRKKGSNSEDDDVPDGIDMNDPYFAEEFANTDFEHPTKPKLDKKSKKKQLEMENDDQEQKNAELSLLLAEGDEDKRSHFSLKKIQATEDDTNSNKKKRKFKKKKMRDILLEKEKIQIQDDFSLNLTDNRFKAVFHKPEFNIDPTNPQFKKTKNMEVLVQEKLKRKPINVDVTESITEKRQRLDPATSVLIKNIKRQVK